MGVCVCVSKKGVRSRIRGYCALEAWPPAWNLHMVWVRPDEPLGNGKQTIVLPFVSVT